MELHLRPPTTQPRMSRRPGDLRGDQRRGVHVPGGSCPYESPQATVRLGGRSLFRVQGCQMKRTLPWCPNEFERGLDLCWAGSGAE